MKEKYFNNVKTRESEGIPPKPLNTEELEGFIQQLLDLQDRENKKEDINLITNLIIHRVPGGVDSAAEVKANFLLNICNKKYSLSTISPEKAVELLGTMGGGYAAEKLVDILRNPEMSKYAAKALKNMILIYGLFSDVAEIAKTSDDAKSVLESWSNAEWFTNGKQLPSKLKLKLYKVDGEVTTDDFSPAKQAVTRADIPKHALYMGDKRFPEGVKTIAQYRAEGFNVTFAADIVGTGSSRKSATNSLMWHIGDDIDFVPNKRSGSIVLGSNIAPIFSDTYEDSGGIPIECDVSSLKTGDNLVVDFEKNTIEVNLEKTINFQLEPRILNQYKAGGRLNYIIGKDLTKKACDILNKNLPDIFSEVKILGKDRSYTRAQKILGKAAGLPGVLPGEEVMAKVTTVGSQDTTGPMTVNELKELCCTKFTTDLFFQSFCHTAAYPVETDLKNFNAVPEFQVPRGGVSLKPADGVIHSWLMRLVVPETVGTGGDSHTRYATGLYFPSGSGLTAFAATLGVMPIKMPESVLVRFSGELKDGITLRDVVNYIPYKAERLGLLEVGKKNIFNGKILEIEGLKDLTVEQAFELTNASAERSTSAGTIDLTEKALVKFTKDNIVFIEAMIEAGYECRETLERRVDTLKEWLKNPEILRADKNAEYAAIIEIDLSEVDEPILACPNNPDIVKRLSDLTGTKIDEVFIGSCMSNIGHLRVASSIVSGETDLPTQLWIAPPTIFDSDTLEVEGHLDIFRKSGARVEIPGCSLCMGNQARVAAGATVMSTSTRNFNNRLGDGANVYLGSAELAALVAVTGRFPTTEEYFKVFSNKISPFRDDIYKYHSFAETGVKI